MVNCACPEGATTKWPSSSKISNAFEDDGSYCDAGQLIDRCETIEEGRTTAANYREAVTRGVYVGGVPFTYRELGPNVGVPLLFLNDITAVLDDWDPAVVDGFSAVRRVILVDLRGVGSSGGATPDSIGVMASDVVAFLEALGLGIVDLLGFSLGGMVAQAIAQERPDLVRKIILAGTAPASHECTSDWRAKLQSAFAKAAAQGKHPKHLLFFSPTSTSQAAADAFLARLEGRATDRDTPVSDETVDAQLAAAAKWEKEASPIGLANVTKPVLIVNGDNDVMVPTINSFHLAQLLPNEVIPATRFGWIGHRWASRTAAT